MMPQLDMSQEQMQEKQVVNQKEHYNLNKLQKRLRRNVGQAIADFNMIEEGDRVMVCLSGGKDSYTMLDILQNLQKSAPINFTLIAVNLDQKQPGFPEDILPAYLDKQGVEYKIVEENTYGIVKEIIPEGKTTCSLCSRLRRGILYRTASELGATKIALGHHRDDILQTLFLNMFYGGKLKGMPPKLMSDDGKHVVIRPLAYCREKDIERFAVAREYPIIPCNLCGSQPNLQRQVIKDMLRDWDKQYPGRIETMFSAMQNVVPSHLNDHKLFDFKSITHNSEIVDGGDLAFDREELPLQPVGWQPEDDEESEKQPLVRLDVLEIK
ncbi:C32 tRNA thiolase [Yersinia frederiksenii]|nr:C32 tRNA thiolase [Yersinia frederiksenii]CNC35229.1 C32 tRNA thiolase [Yersinia frederiksenii]CNG05812.1 C32 tRNA thiolase [Yersinia frederiksenii]